MVCIVTSIRKSGDSLHRNNSTMSAVDKRRIDCEAWVNGKWLICHINDVIYVPDDHRSLMSFAVILDKDLNMRVCQGWNCTFVW